MFLIEKASFLSDEKKTKKGKTKFKLTDYSLNFLKITEALCPPKPNVLLNA